MRLLSHPVVKWLFLASAVVGGVVALFTYWADVKVAFGSLPVLNLVVAGASSLVYVCATMLSWRTLLRDLGSPLPVDGAARLFFVSQIGKYIPGGVWNVVAVGEMGRDHGVPRRSSFGAMLVFWLVSVTSGLLVAGLYVAVAGVTLPGGQVWAAAGLALGLVLLSPPVLRRVLRTGLRVIRRPQLEREPTATGLMRALGWAMAGWLAAGLQVWMLASALASSVAYASAVAGYALAWTAGFLFVVAPAGAGVREVVLAAFFAGSMGAGAVVTLVLVSRFLITLADFALAGLAAAIKPRSLPEGTH